MSNSEERSGQRAGTRDAISGSSSFSFSGLYLRVGHAYAAYVVGRSEDGREWEGRILFRVPV